MSTRVSWKCNRSERLSVIPSSSSSSCSSSYSSGLLLLRLSLWLSCHHLVMLPWALGLVHGLWLWGWLWLLALAAARGMWDRLWRHWMAPKCGLSVIGPSADVPLIPIFLRICVMRKGKGNPHVFVCSAPR
jgi:hypothetical protein